MARFRTFEEIVMGMLEFMRLAQPDADVKPGTVLRDVMIDMPATEISRLYGELQSASGFQTIFALSGVDLDKYARNYGITRRSGRRATGTIVCAMNSLQSNVEIPAGSIFNSRSGQSATSTVDIVVDSTKASLYKSVAVRLSADLEAAGITDEYAVEVPAQATAVGAGGNFGRYQILTPSLAGVSQATNLVEFSGGTGIENDDAFRNRILAIWAGANLGTATAYLAAVRTDPRVISARVVGPGDVEMQRDGTVVSTDPDGNLFIVSPGTGGKVDVVVQGSDIQTNNESYIFNDKSGTGDATDPTNDYVLGQRGIDPALDYSRRKLLFLNDDILPFQPIAGQTTVAGSLSGPNFAEGVNFEIKKDTGTLRGSPFAQDSIHFLTNEINLLNEKVSKVQRDSQDALDYSSVNRIASAQQSITILREEAETDPTNRAFVQLKHTPITAVDRITNLTTGERYRIVSQNPEGTSGALNTTGRVQIAGATLPRSTDIIEANYTWQLAYDRDRDFDNLESPLRVRTAQDSIDWGYASRVELEQSEVSYSPSDGYHVLVEQPISRVINVLTYNEETVVATGNQLILSSPISNILSVLDGDGREVFFTRLSNGAVAGSTISLPLDSVLPPGGSATVKYNTVDIFSPLGTDKGTFAGVKIALADFSTLGTPVLVDYVASFETVLDTADLLSLPAQASENSFVIGGDTITGTQPTFFTWSGGARQELRRLTPTYLQIALTNVPSFGRLTVLGRSCRKISTVFTVARSGLKINLSDAIRSSLGSVPVDAQIADVISLARVTTVAGTVQSVDFRFDLQNIETKDSTWSRTAIANPSLTNTEILLSETEYNLSASLTSGISLQVEFYITYPVSERIAAPASGLFISQRKYMYVEDIRVESGFRNLSNILAGQIKVTPLTQPGTGQQYQANYDYAAPKTGERLTISYGYNRLLSDLMFTLEAVRPISADVLPRAADEYGIDIEMEIVPLPQFTSQGNIAQQVTESISRFVSSLATASILDASDLVNQAYAIAGVDRVTLITFVPAGGTGVRKSITLGKNQYFTVSNISATLTSR